jgi:hypothetical protein
MKIRNGFVSNSSSSSFIIRIKGAGSKCVHCGRGDVPFLELLGSSKGGDSENTLMASGKGAIIEYLTFDWCKSAEGMKTIKKLMKDIPSEELYMISLERGYPMETGIRDGTFGNIEIIQFLGE